MTSGRWWTRSSAEVRLEAIHTNRRRSGLITCRRQSASRKDALWVHCAMETTGVIRPFESRKNAGFTLVEALVVVAMLALLASLAAPSFEGTLRRYRVDSARESFIATLQLARSEAVRTGQRVVLTRLTGCGITLSANNDWSCGWQTFVDADADNTFNNSDAEIQRVEVPSNVSAFKASVVNPGFIAFDRFGSVTQTGQNFRFFPVNPGATEAMLVCFTTGTRIRTVKNVSSSDACP